MIVAKKYLNLYQFLNILKADQNLTIDFVLEIKLDSIGRVRKNLPIGSFEVIIPYKLQPKDEKNDFLDGIDLEQIEICEMRIISNTHFEMFIAIHESMKPGVDVAYRGGEDTNGKRI